MIEANVEKPVSTWAEEEGWFVRKVQWIGRSGCPDRFFAKNGRSLFIEFKRPDKGKDRRTGLQKSEGASLVEAGVEYHFVDNIEDACRILGIKNRAADAYSNPLEGRSGSRRSGVRKVLASAKDLI